MLQKNKNFYKKRGFTIVELAIVVAIIALISAILIPKMISSKEKIQENIVDSYNNDNEIFYLDMEGNLIEDINERRLIKIEQKDGKIFMYFE